MKQTGGGIKCKYIISYLWRSTQWQFILSSYVKQHGGYRRERTTETYDVLVVKYSKFGSKWNYYCWIGFKLLYGRKQFLVITLYLLITNQSWDICVLIRFTSEFWSKINKQGGKGCGCGNKNMLMCIFNKSLIAGRKGASIPDSRVRQKIFPHQYNLREEANVNLSLYTILSQTTDHVILVLPTFSTRKSYTYQALTT